MNLNCVIILSVEMDSMLSNRKRVQLFQRRRVRLSEQAATVRSSFSLHFTWEFVVRNIYAGLVTIGAIAIAPSAYSSEFGVLAWAAMANPTSGYTDFATDMVIGSDGAIYETGLSGYGGFATSDYTTMKYNSTGTQQWTTTYDPNTCGSLRTDAIYPLPAIALDEANDAVYVCGMSCSENGFQMLLLRYDASDGSLCWAKTYSLDEAFYAFADDVAVDSAGDVIITGQLQYDTDDYRIGTVKYTDSSCKDATVLWAVTYDAGTNNNLDAAGRSLAIGSDDDVFVAGQVLGASSTDDYAVIRYNASDGDELWAVEYNRVAFDTYDAIDVPAEIVLDSEDNAGITGSSIVPLYEVNGLDNLTIRVTSGGSLDWADVIDGSADGVGGSGIAVDGDDNLVMVGTAQYSDYVTRKYESDGDVVWTSYYDGPGDIDVGFDVAIDPIGNVYVTGRSERTSSGDPDVATVKYNGSTGSQVWVARYNVLASSINQDESACCIGIAPNNSRIDIVGARSNYSSDASNYLTLQYRQIATP